MKKYVVYSKIKYWTITVTYIPTAVYLAVKSIIYRNDLTVSNEIQEKVREMVADRNQEVRRVYHKYKNGYELIIKL